MANTYTLISSNTVGSGGAASVTFSSIPATYTDLVVKASVRDNRSGIGSNTVLGFNGSTSNFTFTRIVGDGSGVTSDTTFGLAVVNGNTSTSNTFANLEIYVSNYASSNYKSYSVDSVSENNGTDAYQQLTSGLWSITTAISSVNLYPSSGNNWMQHSTFYLYGIKNS
jgi:hypothetical protein